MRRDFTGEKSFFDLASIGESAHRASVNSIMKKEDIGDRDL